MTITSGILQMIAKMPTVSRVAVRHRRAADGAADVYDSIQTS